MINFYYLKKYLLIYNIKKCIAQLVRAPDF